MNAKYSILYNPLSGNKTAKKEVYQLDEILSGNYLTYIEMTEDFDYKKFLKSVTNDERVVLCGGDGTLNKFINEVDEEDLDKPTYYFPLGSGNDFNRDVFGNTEKHLLKLNDYIRTLPVVSVKGIRQKFINGIGYGIDGYCCEVGDELRKTTTKPINYTAIAVKGALFKYKKTNAKVTVDGKEYNYKNVWLAATMFGRFYGGGMMAAPSQDRKKEDKELSVLIFRGRGRIRPLIIFSKIFTGEHIKNKKNCIVLTGKQILVEFDQPRALQIDGETVKDVYSYSAKID